MCCRASPGPQRGSSGDVCLPPWGGGWGGVDSCLRDQPLHLRSGAAAEAAALICSVSAAALFGKHPEASPQQLRPSSERSRPGNRVQTGPVGGLGVSQTPSEEAEGVGGGRAPGSQRVAVPRRANRPQVHVHNTCRHGDKQAATLLSNAPVTSLGGVGAGDGRGRGGG